MAEQWIYTFGGEETDGSAAMRELLGGKGANLAEAGLYRAKANEDTAWPEGFDPVAAGVIFD